MVCQARQRSSLVGKIRSPPSNIDSFSGRGRQDENSQVPSLLHRWHSHLGHHTHLPRFSRRPELQLDCWQPGCDPADNRLRRLRRDRTCFVVSREEKSRESEPGLGHSPKLVTMMTRLEATGLATATSQTRLVAYDGGEARMAEELVQCDSICPKHNARRELTRCQQASYRFHGMRMSMVGCASSRRPYRFERAQLEREAHVRAGTRSDPSQV